MFSPGDLDKYYKRQIRGLGAKQLWKRKWNRKGPPLCWFTRKAKVILVSCTSMSYARAFAHSYLRGDSWACGTRVDVWVSRQGTAAGFYLGRRRPVLGGRVEKVKRGENVTWREVFEGANAFLGTIPTLGGKNNVVSNPAWYCYRARFR